MSCRCTSRRGSVWLRRIPPADGSSSTLIRGVFSRCNPKIRNWRVPKRMDVKRSPREYPDRPIVGVGALIVDRTEGGRVLLVRRGAPPLQGEWSIPGGAVELGETLRAAAEREAVEET